MFDIGWSELVLIGVVTLVVIGPKELPGVLRTVGGAVAKMRRMAGEFQSQFQEALREAELDEAKKTIGGLNDQVSSLSAGFNPIQTIRDEIKGAVTGGNPALAAAPAPEALPAPAAAPAEKTAAPPSSDPATVGGSEGLPAMTADAVKAAMAAKRAGQQLPAPLPDHPSPGQEASEVQPPQSRKRAKAATDDELSGAPATPKRVRKPKAAPTEDSGSGGEGAA